MSARTVKVDGKEFRAVPRHNPYAGCSSHGLLCAFNDEATACARHDCHVDDAEEHQVVFIPAERYIEWLAKRTAGTS